MRARHPAMQAQPQRLAGERLDVARERVVGLVAVQVDHQAALGRDPAQLDHRAAAVLHGALEVRDAADDVDPEIQRAQQVRP